MMRKRQSSTRQAVDSSVHEVVRSVYQELEARRLPRSCQMLSGCCHFLQTRRTPMLTLGEALFAARGVRASGRKKLQPHPDGACPLLGADRRCTIYEHRPFGCRTHFCKEAGGIYPRGHVQDLIRRLEELDEKLGGEGPRSLETALSDVL